MSAYHNERLENAICYFAREHLRRAKSLPTQTHIYKYLAFFDLELLQETGSAPLELEYCAMDYGPVPIELYKNRREIESDLFQFVEREDNKFDVKPLGSPDMDYFSDREREKMDELLYIFAQPGVKAKAMSAASHEKLIAWKRARERGANSLIRRSDSFPAVEGKSDSELTGAEEHFLIVEAIRRAGP